MRFDFFFGIDWNRMDRHGLEQRWRWSGRTTDPPHPKDQRLTWSPPPRLIESPDSPVFIFSVEENPLQPSGRPVKSTSTRIYSWWSSLICPSFSADETTDAAVSISTAAKSNSYFTNRSNSIVSSPASVSFHSARISLAAQFQSRSFRLPTATERIILTRVSCYVVLLPKSASLRDNNWYVHNILSSKYFSKIKSKLSTFNYILLVRDITKRR
jgi:hypothetical protein